MASYRVGLTLRGGGSNFDPRGRVASLEVLPESLHLRLGVPSTFLDAAGVQREYLIPRAAVQSFEMTWSGALQLIHSSSELPESVYLSGEWDLVTLLQAAGYSVVDTVPWSLSVRRTVAVVVIGMELLLLTATVLSTNFVTGLAALVGMPVASIVAWRLQRSV